MLGEIESKFLYMIKMNKVDLSVLPLLEEYKSKIAGLKSKLITEKGILNKFHYFYSLDVVLRVIETLSNRVKIAEIVHDNPKVARDALAVMPFIQRIDIELRNKEFRNVNNFELGSNLQIEALKNDMYPNSKEVLNEIDKSQIKKDFNLFCQRVI